MAEHIKIPLPKFLKVLTSHSVPVPKAMNISGKMCISLLYISLLSIRDSSKLNVRYKEFNTPAKLAELNEAKLISAGVDSKEDRRLVMVALRESGYILKDSRRKKLENTDNSSTTGPSTPRSDAVQVVVQPNWNNTPFSSHLCLQTTPTKGKRKRRDDINDLLPTGPTGDDEAAGYGNLNFGEVLDEEVWPPSFR